MEGEPQAKKAEKEGESIEIVFSLLIGDYQTWYLEIKDV